MHQIGRTGRSGKTGIATTFVNMQTAEQTLLDLKYLLMEAKQKYVLAFSTQGLTQRRIPPFLATIEDPNAGAGGMLGCTNCGGQFDLAPPSPCFTMRRLTLYRTGTLDHQLSQAGGHGQAYGSGSPGWTGRRGILTASVLALYHCITSYSQPSNRRVQRAGGESNSVIKFEISTLDFRARHGGRGRVVALDACGGASRAVSG